MLSDFLMLEVYFGSQNSALYFEDLVKRYGRGRLVKAVHEGDLVCRKLRLGPDKGRTLTWLSQQGRGKVISET